MRTIIVVVVVILVAILLFLGWKSFFGYWNEEIKSGEQGMQLKRNVPYQAVQEGVYTDTTLFADMAKWSVTPRHVCYTNDEVALSGLEQFIGATVCANVRNPEITEYDIIGNWSTCSMRWVDFDNVTGKQMSDDKTTYILTSNTPAGSVLGQALKECAGSRTLLQSAVGSNRGDLAQCVSERSKEMMYNDYCGVRMDSVVIPDITVPDEIKTSITNFGISQSQTLLLNQQAKEEEARGVKALAVETAKTKVEQGKLQEEARQRQNTLIEEAKAEEARKALINAQTSNLLLQANQRLEVAKIERAAADEAARSKTASDLAFAQICQKYPEYCKYLADLAAYQAFGQTDKVYVDGNFDPRLWLQNAPSMTTEP